MQFDHFGQQLKSLVSTIKELKDENKQIKEENIVLKKEILKLSQVNIIEKKIAGVSCRTYWCT